MKIEATCNTCARTFLLSQIGPESDSPGRCPFCGARFGRHYTTVLPETVAAAEASGSDFVHLLSRLQDLETGFDIDLEGLLAGLAHDVRQNERQQRPA
jgi:hypothetical protein